MKHALEVFLIAFVLTAMAGAQDPTKPMRRPGITVQMPVSSQAVEMPAADEEDATVVTVTADGCAVISRTTVVSWAEDFLRMLEACRAPAA